MNVVLCQWFHGMSPTSRFAYNFLQSRGHQDELYLLNLQFQLRSALHIATFLA